MSINRLLLPAVLMAASPLAFAGYGLNSYGYAGESYAMGGADVARADNALGSNVNPAGMSHIKQGNFSVNLDYFDLSGWKHSDSLGNSKTVAPPEIITFGGGYARRLPHFNNVVLGVAVSAQGGIGYTYPSLRTEAGNDDELSATFGVYRIAPAIAWQATDALSVGLSVGINYSEAEQKVFPDTYVASSGFSGMKIEKLSGISGSYRLGLQYNLTDNLVLGFAYGSSTKLRLEDGNAVVNFDPAGLGKVRYAKVSTKGLELPEEWSLGFSWQSNPRWELAAETTWLRWSNSIKSTTLTLTQSNNPLAADTISATSELNFRDQYTLSLGTRYLYSDGIWLMAGYTYGKNPVPKNSTSPTLSVISEHHYTAGASQQFTPNWKGVVTLLYIDHNSVSYTNNDLPLGGTAKQNAEMWGITFLLERGW